MFKYKILFEQKRSCAYFLTGLAKYLKRIRFNMLENFAKAGIKFNVSFFHPVTLSKLY